MPPRPFTTDGCSGWMSWGWRFLTGHPPPWDGCCVEHDRLYWMGGSAAQRRQADQGLMACVIRSGHPWWAMAMYPAVRLGGMFWLPLPWRWGYGWPWPQTGPKP